MAKPRHRPSPPPPLGQASTPQRPTARGLWHQLANAVNLAFHPMFVQAGVLLVLAWPVLTWPVAALHGLWAVVLPMALSWWVTPRYYRQHPNQLPRRHRLAPLAINAACVGAVGLMVGPGLPPGYAVGVVVVVGLNLLALGLTPVYKISLHLMALAGGLALVFPPGTGWLGLVALVGFGGLVGWARLLVRAHRWHQVMVGALLGYGLVQLGWVLGFGGLLQGLSL